MMRVATKLNVPKANTGAALLGGSPLLCRGVAQLEERQTLDLDVTGSTPVSPATLFWRKEVEKWYNGES